MNQETLEKVRQAILESEASLMLEGRDPMKDPHYREMKEKMWSGELTPAEASRITDEYFKNKFGTGK